MINFRVSGPEVARSRLQSEKGNSIKKKQRRHLQHYIMQMSIGNDRSILGIVVPKDCSGVSYVSKAFVILISDHKGIPTSSMPQSCDSFSVASIADIIATADGTSINCNGKFSRFSMMNYIDVVSMFGDVSMIYMEIHFSSRQQELKILPKATDLSTTFSKTHAFYLLDSNCSQV